MTTQCVHLRSVAVRGFGRHAEALERRSLLRDRHDRRAASLSDLTLIATVREAAPELFGAPSDETLAAYIGGCKRLGGSLISSGLRSGALGSSGRLPEDDRAIVEALKLTIDPFFAVAALPNISMYLLARSFGVAGPSDHFTCEPWSDVAAVMAAYDALLMGEASRVIAAATTVTAELESEDLLAERRPRALETPDAHSGAAAVVLDRDSVGPTLCSPFMWVGSASRQRDNALMSWLGGFSGRVLYLSHGHTAPGRAQHQPIPEHNAPTLATFAGAFADAPSESIAVVTEFDDAVVALGVEV